MTIAPEERQFVTKSIFAVALGVAALGTAIFAVVLHYASTGQLFSYQHAANSGDTPVILVGGTVTFKAGSKRAPQTWATNQDGLEYHVNPNYKIAAIVIKSAAPQDDNDNPTPGDDDSATDILRVDISNTPADTNSAWEVQAFANIPKTSSEETQVASIFPQLNANGTTEIHVLRKDMTQGATFCINNNMKRIFYGRQPTCADKETFGFSRISITVSGVTIGSLKCADASGTKGICRIVFRGPPS